MARTNRRREPGEVVNVNRSMKRHDRKSTRKSIKKQIQQIDYSNLDEEDFFDEDSLSNSKGEN